MKKLKSYSPVVLRIGIAVVFLWFGINQISDPSQWLDYVPQWVSSLSGLSIPTIVFLNGIFEITFGAALLLGFFTRFVSLILALHMLDIMTIVGLNAIGVRDFGLSIAIIAIFMDGDDFLTLDKFIEKEIEK